MALFFRVNKEHYQLAIWKMEEELDELLHFSALSAADLARAESFTHMARKKEWISIRLLLKQLGRDISIRYLESGKPVLDNSPYHISIAHTRDYAGLIISKDFNVGIDLERIHPRIEKIAHKFVSADEEKLLHGTSKLEKLFIIWGAKEVLFKMHSLGDLIFKEHLLVHPFVFSDPGIVQASLNKDEFRKTYTMNYQRKEDLLITWCIDNESG